MTSQKQGEDSIQDSRTESHKKMFAHDYLDGYENYCADTNDVEVEEPAIDDVKYNPSANYVYDDDNICYNEGDHEQGNYYLPEKSENNVMYNESNVEENNINYDIDHVKRIENVDTDFSTAATTELTETTACSTNSELERVNEIWNDDDQSDDQEEYRHHLDDDKSTTTQSVVLNSAIESSPSLVQTMLHSSSWYNAFRSMESRSQGSGLNTGEDEDEDEGDGDAEGEEDVNAEENGDPDHTSCATSIMSGDHSESTSSSDPFANFTDYQLFQLQQYRIDELNEQLEKVRASVSEYHNLLDRFQTIQDENLSLKKRVKEVEEELKFSEEERNKEKLKKEEVEISRDLAVEVIDLKLSLAEAQTNGDFMNKANAERIKTLEDTVVKLKMELADCKSKEDWARLKPSRFFRS